MKLQSFFGDASVLKVCKFNTNYAIKCCKCTWEKYLLNVDQKCFLIYMTTAGKTISCPWLFINLLFNKRTAPMGENSSKRNYFYDGKHRMDNFNTTKLQRFS